MFGKKINKRRRSPVIPLASRIPRNFTQGSFLLWGGIIFGAILIGGMIAFYVYFFRISEIDIKKNDEYGNLQYAKMQMMMESVKQENLILLSTGFLKKQLFISFPEIKDIKILKKFPQTLILEPSLDPLVFKWIYKIQSDPDHQYFGYVSHKGIYFKHGPQEIFTVFEETPRKEYIPSITPLLEKEEVKNILDSKEQLESVTGRKMIKMRYLRDAQEIHFYDEKDVAYWIFLKKESQKQINKLSLVLSERNIYKKPIEYIDLRISRKVIYKPL